MGPERETIEIEETDEISENRPMVLRCNKLGELLSMAWTAKYLHEPEMLSIQKMQIWRAWIGLIILLIIEFTDKNGGDFQLLKEDNRDLEFAPIYLNTVVWIKCCGTLLFTILGIQFPWLMRANFFIW